MEPAKNPTTELSLSDRLKIATAAAAVGFEVSPANEATRAYIGFAILESTHNPLLVGAGIGLSTLAIEGASGISAASALRVSSTRVEKIKDKLRGRVNRTPELTIKDTFGDSVQAISGLGSAGVVAKKHLQGNRTFDQDKKTIALTAGAIAGFSAGIGALAGGGIEYAERIGLGDEAETIVNLASDWRVYAGALALSASYPFIKKRMEGLRNNKPFEIRMVTSEDEVQQSLALEQKIWDMKGYGDTGYDKYFPQSRIFSAFNRTSQECIGTVRLFSGQPELPPFVSAKEMRFYDASQKSEIIQGCIKGAVEEFGTVAVHPDAPKIEVNLELCRVAYRDAYDRGIRTWGAIMEPRRVKLMNGRYGFDFRQVGPESWYQGGYCAPHIMDLEEVRTHMKEKQPERYEWFVNEPLR